MGLMTNAISIQSLTKSYHSNQPLALDHVSFYVKEGQFFGLLGPNGAGKTTLIGILSSLVRASSGSIEVFGKDLFSNWNDCKQYFGVMPQEFNFNLFEHAEQIVSNQAGYYGITKSDAIDSARYWIDRLGLWDHRHKGTRMLSGGMKRRLMIARALVHHPKILILDEPTAGVDISLRRSMWEIIQELNDSGMTIILTTHYLEEAERLCDTIGIINEGQLIKLDKTENLLDILSKERVVLSSRSGIPDLQYSFEYHRVSANVIEVELNDKLSLTDLMGLLSKQNVSIDRVQNKSGRLEEVFVQLVEKK